MPSKPSSVADQRLEALRLAVRGRPVLDLRCPKLSAHGLAPSHQACVGCIARLDFGTGHLVSGIMLKGRGFGK
jgi:hypothetical protein